MFSEEVNDLLLGLGRFSVVMVDKFDRSRLNEWNLNDLQLVSSEPIHGNMFAKCSVTVSVEAVNVSRFIMNRVIPTNEVSEASIGFFPVVPLSKPFFEVLAVFSQQFGIDVADGKECTVLCQRSSGHDTSWNVVVVTVAYKPSYQKIKEVVAVYTVTAYTEAL